MTSEDSQRVLDKKFLKSIVRRVHPDLFTAHPYERARNSESLKLLNVYCDDVSRGVVPQASQLEFWLKEDTHLTKLEAELPSHGSLGPLFYAFGLITQEELQRGAGCYELGHDDRNFLEWLTETVAEAVRTAEQHEALKRCIRELRAAAEERFRLAAVQVGGEFAVTTAEQLRQIAALKVLTTCLAALTLTDPDRFEGLTIRLYHPDSCPFGTYSYIDQHGAYNMRTDLMQSYVAEDGTLHVVAERRTIREAVAGLDLERARLLARLSLFWVRRVREMTPALREVLGVEAVWCDTRTQQSSQKFVLWAGAVFEQRAAFAAATAGRRLRFSVLVHADAASPMLDFLASSAVLQVRADCPPPLLLEFLGSEAGGVINDAAAASASAKAEEEALLEAVRSALGAKHVICVCSSYDQVRVMEAANRLLDNAHMIRCSVDLSGASIAIDDCYEMWESGFISIPYDFQLQELQPQLKKLLSSGPSSHHSIAGNDLLPDDIGSWDAHNGAYFSEFTPDAGLDILSNTGSYSLDSIQSGGRRAPRGATASPVAGAAPPHCLSAMPQRRGRGAVWPRGSLVGRHRHRLHAAVPRGRCLGSLGMW